MPWTRTVPTEPLARMDWLGCSAQVSRSLRVVWPRFFAIVALESRAGGATMLDLPDPGLYRTTEPMPGHEDGIPAGVLVYLGVAVDDDESDAAYLAEKVRYLRIFPCARRRGLAL